MVVIGKKKTKKIRNRLPQKRRRQWNVREKLMVINFYENNNRNVRGTAKKFNIEPKQVRDWAKKKEKMLKSAPHIAKIHPGKSPKYPNLEEELFSWITEKRDNGNAVNRKLITRKAISLSKNRRNRGIIDRGIAGFKFSSKWLDGF